MAETNLLLPLQVDVDARHRIDPKPVDRAVSRRRLNQKGVAPVDRERNAVGVLHVIHAEHMVHMAVRIDGHDGAQPVLLDVFRQRRVLLRGVSARIDDDALVRRIRQHDRILLKRIGNDNSGLYHIFVLYLRRNRRQR